MALIQDLFGSGSGEPIATLDHTINDDTSTGWSKPLRKATRRIRGTLRRAKRNTNLSRKKKKPGALILLRCVQSTFNENHKFTGWLDPHITDQGKNQYPGHRRTA